MITIYTITYNEELLMQFMIDHYRSRFPNCHIIVYDNKSTDNTVNIAIKNGCEIRGYESNNSLNDRIHMELKNSCWTTAGTDWVLVCDLDELLDITEEELKQEESNGNTIIRTEAWTMINLENNYDFQNITHGYRDHGYDKSLLFNKKFIQSINYGAGAHDCKPVGNVKYSNKSYPIHHYMLINPDHFVAKCKVTQQRLSEENKRNNWGYQVQKTEEVLRSDFEMLRDRARAQNAPLRRKLEK